MSQTPAPSQKSGSASAAKIKVFANRLEDHLKSLPEKEAEAMDYEVWGKKFMELWVSVHSYSLLSRSLITLIGKIHQSSGSRRRC